MTTATIITTIITIATKTVIPTIATVSIRAWTVLGFGVSKWYGIGVAVWLKLGVEGGIKLGRAVNEGSC